MIQGGILSRIACSFLELIAFRIARRLTSLLMKRGVIE